MRQVVGQRHCKSLDALDATAGEEELEGMAGRVEVDEKPN